jgi:hypothetical protein
LIREAAAGAIRAGSDGSSPDLGYVPAQLFYPWHITKHGVPVSTDLLSVGQDYVDPGRFPRQALCFAGAIA